ncbi:hypothetical protein Tco_0702531 [Tanacetum coccineum]|uniref:Reverse transcriptase domain-containing protein n=1 Tax=Tanacetum coccineum TaxID=301880 RepID=A0ABQ4XW83_9ASTR
MHLAVHNIKKREDESTKAFSTRYIDDTLQILGLHEDQRIYSFVHGLRTRNLVEFLSTYLPSTYKGLMEKTYTWIKVREVATNGTSNGQKESFKRSDSPHDLLLGRTAMQQLEIIVSTIYGAIKFHMPRGIGTILSEYKSYMTKEEQETTNKTSKECIKDILSYVDAEERMIDLLKANADVFTRTIAHLTGVPKNIMVEGEPFKTEHIMNEFKHKEPVKQKKKSLAPERSEAIRVQVEELIKANNLREFKYQTWVSNPVIVKKRWKWKLCIDFTDINKACPKEHYPLPVVD